jgi:hypothetical protein
MKAGCDLGKQAKTAKQKRDLLNRDRAVVERSEHLLPPKNLRFAERYQQGNFQIHVHLRSRLDRSRESEQFCILFYGFDRRRRDAVDDGLPIFTRRLE